MARQKARQAPGIELTDAMRRQAFDYYANHPGVTLNAIMLFLGIGRTRFRHLRREWNWPPRAEAMAAASRDADHDATALDATPDDAGPTARGLGHAAAALTLVTRLRLNALIKEQNPSLDIDHDRTARTLAAYAKTLTIAQSLLEQEGEALHGPDPADPPPRSLHDLRDELASHLERIVAEEEARGSDGLLV